MVVGGGQVGDQRPAAGRGEDPGDGGRDGLLDQALHVGHAHPAVVGQYPVRAPGDGLQPDDLGHLAGGDVTVRGGDQQPLDGQQGRLQLGPRQQPGITAPRVQPQAPVDLVKAEPERGLR